MSLFDELVLYFDLFRLGGWHELTVAFPLCLCDSYVVGCELLHLIGSLDTVEDDVEGVGFLGERRGKDSKDDDSEWQCRVESSRVAVASESTTHTKRASHCDVTHRRHGSRVGGCGRELA